MRHRTLAQPGEAPIAAELESPPHQLEAEHCSGILQEKEIGAGSAARIEQRWIRHPGDRFREERRDEAFEAAIPEVPLFRVESSFDKSTHGSATRKREIPAMPETIDTRTYGRYSVTAIASIVNNLSTEEILMRRFLLVG